MLFVLRLTNGDCVVAEEADEFAARQTANRLSSNETQVASVRRLGRFAMQFSPTEDASLEVAHWDDAVLDDILAHEYPLLDEAYRHANAVPFAMASDPEEPILSDLKAAYEQNTEIIRQGLYRELRRLSQQNVSSKVKSA